jgi:hypothetical protein
MKMKMIRKLMFFNFVVSVLFFISTFVLVKPASAAAPADLQVGMALQRWGVSGTEPLNYGANVKVVPKTTTNGINIPISSSPYFGKHLDTNNNGSPDSNDLTFGMGPTVNNNILGGGTYYSNTYNNLIWCGNSAGVPDKQFQLDVSVGYATANEQTISVGGVNYKGKWTGFWNFEATGSLGEKSFFNGKTVRVPALNPYKTFVFFVFVEDPPPVLEGIKVTKFNASDPGNAGVALGNTSSAINQNYKLNPGESIYSNDGRFQMKMQTDGNLVVYDRVRGNALWSIYGLGATLSAGSGLWMQQDGNLVVYKNNTASAANVVWSSGTNGTGADYVVVANDGKILIRDNLGTPLPTDPGVISGDVTKKEYLLNTQGMDPYPKTPSAVNTAKVEILNSSGTVVSTGTANPYIKDLATGTYSVRVTVPEGWSLRSSVFPHNANTCTDNTAKTGTCTIPNVVVANDVFTPVDLVFWPVGFTYGLMNDVCNDFYTKSGFTFPTNTGKVFANMKDKAWGWAYDGTLPGGENNGPAKVRLTFDDGYEVEVLANDNRPDLPINTPNSQVLVEVGAAHGFEFSTPDQYFDGKPHSVTASIIQTKGDVETEILFGNVPFNFTCPKYSFPWLQTQNGDVVANGKIVGQKSGNQYLGSRSPSNTDKEAEFLVISALGGDENNSFFCSTFSYLLTNTTATGQGSTCENGTGYKNINTYSLGSDGKTNSTYNDKLLQSVEEAYKSTALDASCRTTVSPDASNGIQIPNYTNSCPDGRVIKVSLPANATGTLFGFTAPKGRTTIFIDGNVNISTGANILYNNVADASIQRLQDVPNLAIVVNGNLGINPPASVGTQTINGLIYSSGKINTCPSTPALCASRLVVNGSLIAKNGFNFNRTFANETSRLSAEQINFTPQSMVYPPPGINSRFFSDIDYNIDTNEYSPRF